MKKPTPTLAALAIGVAVLVPAGVASARSTITTGVGEVNLGPIVIPNTAKHWTVTWSYNGRADVSQSVGGQVVAVQIDVETGYDPANGGTSLDPTNLDPASQAYPEAEPTAVSAHGQLRYCSNACEAKLDYGPLTTKYWLIMDVCPMDGSGPLPTWTVKISYDNKGTTVVLPAPLHLATRGGPDGLTNCDGHLT